MMGEGDTHNCFLVVGKAEEVECRKIENLVIVSSDLDYGLWRSLDHSGLPVLCGEQTSSLLVKCICFARHQRLWHPFFNQLVNLLLRIDVWLLPFSVFLNQVE